MANLREQRCKACGSMFFTLTEEQVYCETCLDEHPDARMTMENELHDVDTSMHDRDSEGS